MSTDFYVRTEIGGTPVVVEPLDKESPIPEAKFSERQLLAAHADGAPGRASSDGVDYLADLRQYWQYLFCIAFNGPLPTDEQNKLARIMGRIAMSQKAAKSDLDIVRLALNARLSARGLSSARDALQAAQRRVCRLRDGVVCAATLQDLLADVNRLSVNVERAQVGEYQWNVFKNTHMCTFDAEQYAVAAESGVTHGQ